MKHKVLIVIILISLVTFSSGVTYSLFHSDASLAVKDQEIAEFIFETNRTNHFDLQLLDLKPGDIKEFDFQVVNSDESIVSNVSIEYQITIKTFHFIPLQIDLYKADEVVMTCNEDYSRTRNSDNALVCNSPIMEMGHIDEQLDDYKIVVSFEGNYNDVEFSDLVDYIDVDISSWQKVEE